MIAVFKREFKSYFQGMTGFFFVAFLVFLAGLYTMVYNLNNLYPYFEYVVYELCFFYLIAIPILSMKVVAEEKKQKTDQLLYSLPLSMTQIMAGKFLAMAAVLAIPIGIMGTIPLILRKFGTVNLATAYSSLIAFFLLGCALLAVGLFLSSLTENQIVAAVLSFFTILVCYLCVGLSNYVPTDAKSSLVAFAVLILAFAVLVFAVAKSKKLAVIIAVAGEAVLGIVYAVNQTLFESAFQKLLMEFSLFDRLMNFINGMFDMTSIVYYLTIIAVFLLLTVQVMEKRGFYSILMSVIAIAAAVGMNLFVGSLPSDKVKYDTTPEEIYSLSEQSEQIAGAVDEEVTIYMLASETGKDSSLYEFLERYAAQSDKITIEVKDPVLYPNFADDYTDEDVVSNSLVVVSDKRGRYISYNDIYVSDTSIDYSTYEYVTTTSFDGENCITSAIDYVTSEELPVVYMLTGHGEQSLSDYSSEITDTISGENITISDLSLVKQGEVPEDASAVMIFGPSSDISEDELEMLREYAENGGKFYVLTDYVDDTMVNLKALLADFGMEPVEGIVLEGDREYYYQYQSYLLPDFLTHEITSPLAGKYYMLMGNVQAVQELEEMSDTISVTPLIQTSDDAYSKVAAYNMETYAKEDGDIDGPFYLAAAAEVTYESATAQMVYVPSVVFLSDSLNQLVSGANQDFFMNALDWLCEREDAISIRAKSLDVEYLTIDEQTAGRLAAFFIGVLPVALLITGGVVVFRRKRA